MADAAVKDRAGLGWRAELAAGIFANLHRIDALEVIADDYFQAPSSRISALQTLSRQLPVLLHGVGLGLASTAPADRKRIESMARLIEKVRPECWTEHLAFVRAGGIEIGHLAAPPRNENTLAGLCDNMRLARRITGATPAMENIATLIDPPGSPMNEARWISGAIAASGSELLLDLHNVLTNSINFRYDPYQFLAAIPLEMVSIVHIAGGRSMGKGRRLDDHLHETPTAVFSMLRWVAARTARSLTVILERDGNYPRMEELLLELDRARAAMREGRHDRAGV